MPTLRPWKTSAPPVGFAADILCVLTGETSRGGSLMPDERGCGTVAACCPPADSEATTSRVAGGGVLRPERLSALAPDAPCVTALPEECTSCSFGADVRRTPAVPEPTAGLVTARAGSVAVRPGSRTASGSARRPWAAFACCEATGPLGCVEICILRSRSTNDDRAESGRSPWAAAPDDSGRRPAGALVTRENIPARATGGTTGGAVSLGGIH
mmetsp:Transcript_4203/g.9221  ORF Transcript_4203/g.9221 Transcript_4203/m.9221 type:complete len:213 (-) Transcript_4203:71-709(-)